MANQDNISGNSGEQEMPVRRKKNKHDAPRRRGGSNKEQQTGEQYTGYVLDQDAVMEGEAKKPWFWKILGISLLLTLAVVAGACFFFFHQKQENSRAIEEINEANTMAKLLEGHDNVKIIQSYSHLADGSEDYTTTRQVSMKDGKYYSYLKKEGTSEDYKEVIDDEKLYRYDERVRYFYGLVGDDYQSTCVASIENDVFQGNTDDTIEDEKERENTLTLRLTYDVTDGDDYSMNYGFGGGTRIEKTITVDKKTKLVLSDSESVDDEVFYSYTVEFDKQLKTPKFYIKAMQQKDTRTCTLYSDYDGEDGKEYKYKIPINTYFTVLDHEDYLLYTNEEGTIEFTQSQMLMQNPDTDITLYLKPVNNEDKE